MMELARVRAVMAVIFAAVVSAGYWVFTEYIQKSREETIEEALESEQGPSKQAQPASARVAQIKKTIYQNPGNNLIQLDAILAAPENEKEKAEARALLPQVLELCVHQAIRDGQSESAKTLLARLKSEFPQEQAANNANLAWGRYLATSVLNAIREGSPEKIEPLYQEYIAGGYYLPSTNPKGERYAGDSSVLEKYARFSAERWRDLPPNERFTDTGLVLLESALSTILDHNASFQLYSIVRDSAAPGELILNTANRFLTTKKLVPAFNAFGVTGMILKTGSQWKAGDAKFDHQAREQMQKAVESRVAALAVMLGKQSHETPGAVRSGMIPGEFLQMTIGWVESPVERAKLYDVRLNLAIADYLKSTEPLLGYDLLQLGQNAMPYEAKLRLSESLHTARRDAYRIKQELARAMFENQILIENLDIWKNVSASVIAEVERTVPRDTPANRLPEAKKAVLKKLVHERPEFNPVVVPPDFTNRYLRVLALDGVESLGSVREEAFRKLRELLRHPEAADLVAQVQKAVQIALKNSRANNDFGALIELAGFYVSEFGQSLPGDPFRKEFQEWLQASAKQFKGSDPMKYVFVQALLAAGFPDDPMGKAAQEETIKCAFDLVSNVPLESDVPELVPSGFSGWSSESVDNSTEHHILLVYDGPERFAVLCNPLRKGSFALKNGSYRIAVMTPIGNIRPYRTERTLANQHVVSDYYVITSGSVKPSGSLATGDYTILRQNAELGPVAVSKQTGLLTR